MAMARILKVEDALLYLDQVKKEFSDKPSKYNEFLELMKNFKAHTINIPTVIESVKDMFRGKNNLIMGFQMFLPDEYTIEMTSEEQAPGHPGGGQHPAGDSNTKPLDLQVTPPPTYYPLIYILFIYIL